MEWTLNQKLTRKNLKIPLGQEGKRFPAAQEIGRPHEVPDCWPAKEMKKKQKGE